MLRKLSLFLPLAVVLISASAPQHCHAQKTITVIGINAPPGYPYTTIQSGIDAASDGDTVLVGLASYSENISFKGKAITVTGFVDSSTGTVPAIQGVAAEPAVVFQNGETSSSVFSNFTVANGGGGSELPTPMGPGPYFGLPGAIYIAGSSPTILNNTITQSHCFGVYVQAGAPLIQGNEIDGTYIDSNCPPKPSGIGSGVGLFVTGADALGLPVISTNLIQKNVQGGEVATSAPGGGGAGITLAGPAIVENNTIRDNNANFSTGGGIDIEAVDGVYIMQNLIYGNSASCGGGGIALPGQVLPLGAGMLIANNTIVNNFSGPSYAGKCVPSDQIFSLNIALQDPGPTAVIVNNIFSDSSSDASFDCGATDTPDEIYQPIFDHNILHNAGGSFFGQYCVDVSSKYNNLTADPGFDPNNPYQLTSSSPAIDAGNTSVLQLFHQFSGADLNTDFEGYPRLIDFKGIGYPTIDIGAYEYPDQKLTPPQRPTTMVLTYMEGNGMPTTLTANLQSPQGIPTDTVFFFVDGTPLGSAAIDGSGNATLSKFLLPAGTHVLSATYPGHGTFTPAIAIINVVSVAIIPTSILLTSYSVPPPDAEPSLTSVVGQSVTFTITSTANDGTTPSPVTLTISDKTGVIKTFTITQFNSQNMAEITTTFSASGQYVVEAAYAGNQYYAEGSDTLIQNVIGYPTSITLQCPPAYPSIPFGGTANISATVSSPDGIPPGVVDFSDAGVSLGMPTLINGSASIVYNAINPGPRTIIARYPANGAYGSSSTSCSITVSAQNTLALTSSSPLINGIPTSPAYSPITFTAALTSSNNLTGTYTLNIQGQPPATMQPSASGTTATYTTSTLAPGQYNVSAMFVSSDHSVSISANLSPYQLVTAPVGDFTLTGPSSVTTSTERSASGTLSLASIDGFQGTVALTCNLPLPLTYTCAIAPTSVPLAVGGTGSAVVTLAPTLNRAANDSGTSPILFASLFPLTLLSLAGFFRRRKLSAILPLLVLAILAASTTACGNDIAFPATQPGSYPFTITATGTTRGATTPTTHTLNITLILTP